MKESLPTDSAEHLGHIELPDSEDHRLVETYEAAVLSTSQPDTDLRLYYADSLVRVDRQLAAFRQLQCVLLDPATNPLQLQKSGEILMSAGSKLLREVCDDFSRRQYEKRGQYIDCSGKNLAELHKIAYEGYRGFTDNIRMFCAVEHEARTPLDNSHKRDMARILAQVEMRNESTWVFWYASLVDQLEQLNGKTPVDPDALKTQLIERLKRKEQLLCAQKKNPNDTDIAYAQGANLLELHSIGDQIIRGPMEWLCVDLVCRQGADWEDFVTRDALTCLRYPYGSFDISQLAKSLHKNGDDSGEVIVRKYLREIHAILKEAFPEDIESIICRDAHNTQHLNAANYKLLD